MIRMIRVWWYTRWFMKHWDVKREFARYCAVQRVNCLERDAR